MFGAVCGSSGMCSSTEQVTVNDIYFIEVLKQNKEIQFMLLFPL